jgi:hypothetical protein
LAFAGASGVAGAVGMATTVVAGAAGNSVVGTTFSAPGLEAGANWSSTIPAVDDSLELVFTAAGASASPHATKSASIAEPSHTEPGRNFMTLSPSLC